MIHAFGAPMEPIRVGILTDTTLFADSLARLLDADPACVRVDLRESPDVLLVDAAMDAAVDACARAADTPHVSVIAFAVPDDSALGEDLLIAGARGILYRSAPERDLTLAIPHVHGGKLWAPRHVVAAAWRKCRPAPDAASRIAGWTRLSVREREVLRYAASGFANKELADRLAISEATVKVHLTHIFQKVGCHSRAELAAAYHGVVPLSAERGVRRA